MTYYLNKRSNEVKDESNKILEAKSKIKTKTNSQWISCVKSLWNRKKQAFLFTNDINMDRS